MAGKALDKRQLGIMFAINVILLLLLSPLENFLFYIIIAGFTGLVIGYLNIENQDYYIIRKWAMLTMVIGVGLFAVAIFTNIGGGPGKESVVIEMTNHIQSNLQKSLDAGLMDFYDKQGISRSSIEAAIKETANWTAHHIAALLYLQGLLAAFLILTIQTRILKKSNPGVLLKKPFSEEMMPWQLTWGVILGLAAWLWGRDSMNTLYYLGSNLLLVLAPISFYFGSAVLRHRYINIPDAKKKWAFMFLLIILFLSPQGLGIFVIMMGIFDSLLDYRKLNKDKEVKK